MKCSSTERIDCGARVITKFEKDSEGKDSAKFWELLQTYPHHYFINVLSPKLGRIHRADCFHMVFENPEATNFLSKGKLCAEDRSELVHYAADNGIEVKRCADCDGVDQTTSVRARPASVPPSTNTIEELGVLFAPRRAGQEVFHDDDKPLGFNLLDFWGWDVSDLVSNATRGILAEYIVARAIGISTSGVRNEWAAYDLITNGGVKVEVKSCAYLQAWFQARVSKITFSTRLSRAWDPATNVLSPESKRQADVYVFALLAHRDKPTLDPMNVAQWRFYVLPTWRLNDRKGSQRSITLKSLETMCSAVPFDGLRVAVEQAAGDVPSRN
jgi:hypothetical protein